MRTRNREILLTLSDKDYRKLERDRVKAGMTRQEYILNLMQRMPLYQCPKPDLKRAKKLFDTDGKRINDMTHNFHATGQINISEYASLVNTLYDHMVWLEEEITEEIRRLRDEEESRNKT